MYELGKLPIGAQELHTELGPFASKRCKCGHTIHTLGPGVPPEVRCLNCDTNLGFVSWSWWENLRHTVDLRSLYMDFTFRWTQLQLDHPNWEVFMVQEKPTVVPDEDLKAMLSVMPGHIVWITEADRIAGQFCAHRWILKEDSENPIPEAKCILCGGIRSLTQPEVNVIEQAEQAGVVFLKWQDRFDELSKLQHGSRKQTRRRSRRSGSKATGGVEQAAQVPEGFVEVKEAAAQLGMEPKKLRRQIRAGRYEGVKVGGRVYCKIS